MVNSLLFLRYNIAYGNLAASDEEIREAARKSALHAPMMRFPLGCETKVGERGLMISGGEKHRLAIARTVLKTPSVLLVDEFTSSLESYTETAILNSLEHLTEPRTAVYIADRSGKGSSKSVSKCGSACRDEALFERAHVPSTCGRAR